MTVRSQSTRQGDSGPPSTLVPPVPTTAQVAKAALRRLALAKLEPTPENYARAFAEEAGAVGMAEPPVLPEQARLLIDKLAGCATDDILQREELVRSLANGHWEEAHRLLEPLSHKTHEKTHAQGRELANLIERITRGLERSGRQWTAARKKDSLQRVLDGSRSDMQRLLQRLRQLVTSWDSDTAEEGSSDVPAAGDAVHGTRPPETPAETEGIAAAAISPASAEADPSLDSWNRVAASLETAVMGALPTGEPRAAELADELAALRERIANEGATPGIASAVEDVCVRARRLFTHRHHLVETLRVLCQELTAGLTDLAEDDSWAKGQCVAMQQRLAEGTSARSVRSATELLEQTRARQAALRQERERAREALKAMINRMLTELGELGAHTGRFQESVGRYADVIEQADSLESLAGVVREMVEESRAVHSLVAGTRQRLNDEHSRAAELAQRVEELEGELRRVSEELCTDPLTQINNRRGLMQAFEIEQSRLERNTDPEAPPLCMGLLDIDNFKKLNDTMGHAVGDIALKELAAHVQNSLRPLDTVARFGGEEFVVLLPATPLEEAQQVLTRLQRSLSASLFMHDGREVFVTFSAGVTAYRLGEPIEQALDRADEALYEAKRTGKNRTCVA